MNHDEKLEVVRIIEACLASEDMTPSRAQIEWLIENLREAWADAASEERWANQYHKQAEKLREDLKKVHVCKLMPECSKEQVENIRLRSEVESLHLELAEKTGVLNAAQVSNGERMEMSFENCKEFIARSSTRAWSVLNKWDRTRKEDGK